MRAVLFKLHMLGGLLAAVFLFVVALSGAIIAFEPELDRLANPRLLCVTPAGTPLPLTELATRATAAHPGRVITYGLGVSPDLSYSVNVSGTLVFVNQYTGEILGTRSGPTLLSQIHQIHLRLLMGETGKTIVSWSGVLMLLLTISGLYLWWPVKRVVIRWAAGGRRRWFDLHNLVGVFAFVFLFVLALTGVMIGFERVTTPLLYRVTGSQPAAQVVSVTGGGTRTLTPDEAIAAARAAMPGAAPIGINAPGNSAAYRVAMRFPEDLTPGGRTRVFIDPHSGQVLQAESSRTAPAGTRLVTLNRAIHTGDIFGLFTKALMSIASLAAAAQVVTGIAMWWKRRGA